MFSTIEKAPLSMGGGACVSSKFDWALRSDNLIESNSKSDRAASPAPAVKLVPCYKYFWPQTTLSEITAVSFLGQTQEGPFSVSFLLYLNIISHWKCPKTSRMMSRSYPRRTGWWNVSNVFTTTAGIVHGGFSDNNGQQMRVWSKCVGRAMEEEGC